MKKITFKNPCFAESVTCDFEDKTWTFEPVENFIVGAGKYVIMPIAAYYEENNARIELQRACVDILGRFESCISGGNGELEDDKPAIARAKEAIENVEAAE